MNHQTVFRQRIERVAAHIGNTNATLHIGMDDQLPQAALLRNQICGPKSIVGAQRAPLGLALAFVSGLAGWTWAHWMRVSLFPAEDALLNFGADLLVGITALFLLRAVLGLRGPATLAAQVVGMALALLCLHNAVHLWPEQFAYLFPSQWVSAVLADTQPMSVNLGAFAAL